MVFRRSKEMNLSKDLEHHKAKYEAKHKQAAFINGQPTIDFTESIIRVMNYYLKESNEVDLYLSAAMLEIKAELI